jgi:hypothetical protein
LFAQWQSDVHPLDGFIFKMNINKTWHENEREKERERKEQNDVTGNKKNRLLRCFGKNTRMVQEKLLI